jgi:4-amino-4-deoxy-L-arabinose transferase-like glycosyltransferase
VRSRLAHLNLTPANWALILLLLATFLRGLVWLVSLPIWQGPDEPAHFSYVQSLAEQHRIPYFGEDDFSPEMRRSMALTRFAGNDEWLSQREFVDGRYGPGERESWSAPPQDRQSHLVNKAGAYAPVYYLAGVPFYYLGRPWGVIGSLFAVRLLDVLLGVLAIYLTVLAGRALWPTNPGLPLVGGGLLAFQPMFDQGTTMVNNDAGIYAVGAGWVALGLAALRRRPDWRSGLALGALAGLGFVIKPTFGLVAGAALTLFLLRLWLWRPLRAAWIELGGMVAGSLLTAGWWVAASYLNRGGLVAQLPAFGTTGEHSLGSYLAVVRRARFEYLFRAWLARVWGDFAWLNTALPMGVYLAIEAVLVFCLLGLVIWFVRRRWERRPLDEPSPAQIAFLASALLGGMLFLHISDALLFIRTGGLLLQGRYLLALGPALVLCLLVGALAWLPSRGRPAGAMLLLGGMIALNALSVGILWQRFYT